MSEHPINELMGVTMEKIKEMVDVNTIIGNPITTPDGTVIIPVSKVSYGFASGGSDIPTKQEKNCFGGGSGAGVTINPVGFLAISNGDVKMISIEKYDGATDRVVAMVPDVIDKISSFFKKDKKGNEKAEEKSDIVIDDPII
ncbi:MAG: GerW family sporulation protein [Bacillota bacterium]|nr:GerW family sporulation protein [Bacillota bacterium]